MASLTKTVDGKALPAEKFAMVLDPQDASTWHLPIDDDHIDSAVKMFGHEMHGSVEQKQAAARKIASAAKSKGIDTKDFEDKYCHAENNDGWIEIFRAGEYPGKAPVTRADLERVVRNYDPSSHEAPVVVGHPKTDAPAYAWVERLALDGDTLLMKERQTDPEFHKLRRAGRYKKRSAAFYPGADGHAMALRHVGYLGAEPPAVKGLKDVSFNDAGREYIEVEFGEEESVADSEKSVKDQIKEFFAPMFGGGANPQPQQFSESDVSALVTKAVEASTKPLQDQVKALETKLADQSTQFTEREKKLVFSETQQRADAAIAKLKTSGRWIPAFEKSGMQLLFAELAKDSKELEFGEGDGKKKVTPLQILTSFMEGLPRYVPNGRIVAVDRGASPGAKKGTGDPLTDLARARAADKKITFSEALTAVVEENPDLAAFPQATAGAA